MVKRIKSNDSNNSKSRCFSEGVGKTRRSMLMTESNNGVRLNRMNTDVMPVVDFGCYAGALKEAFDDVFVYDFIELDNFDPSDENYEEVVELVNDEYNGTQQFFDQVLRYAPSTIQKAFDEYGIKITVIPDSCDWRHPRFYNYEDDMIEFDATVDPVWVIDKFREIRNDPSFKKFMKTYFSSRDGFISFMPDDPESYDEIMDPSNSEYWKVVAAIVQYMVNSDPTIMYDVTEDLLYSMLENHEYVTCSELGIY